MRIAMIGPKRIPSREGGVDVVVGKLSSLLVEKGHQVDIFVRKNKQNKKQKEYNGCRIRPTFTINKKSTDALIYSFFATLKALFGKYDVIHYHAEGNTFFLWMTRWSKKKIVVTCHGIDWKRDKFKGLGTKVLLKSEKRIVKYADTIITLCENDRDYFRETYNKETVLIPNGFERYELVEPKLITEQYGLTKESYILFLARIVPEKGLHYLIEAYNQIDIPQKLVIAGGDSHSKDYYSKMVDLARDNKNIIFTGFVQGQILEELFSNAYLYVLPSDIEGMPMSLLEALGHQRVCLVSNIRENMIDIQNCYFFQKGDSNDLGRVLISVSSGKKKYENNDNLLNWNRVIENTLKVYKEFECLEK